MKPDRRLFIIFLMFLMCFEVKSQEQKIRIAILDLEVSGVDTSVIIGLSNRLRAELVETGQFDVMERNRMSEILQEQGFQQTGACNSDECIIEAGKMLSVAKMVAGSVSRVNSLFTVTLRMIDVETTNIELFVTEDTQGPIENVLTQSLRNIAQKFVARLNPMAYLTLNTSPENCQIFIDDVLAGVSPFAALRVQPGIHHIRVEKQDFISVTQEHVFQAENETQISISLEPAASLFIQSEPSEAEIFIDGVFKGLTPLTIPNLNPGQVKIKLQHRLYQPYITEMILTGGKTERVDVQLNTRFGALSVESVPSGANIEVDGLLKGQTPLEITGLAFGKHHLRISKEGFSTQEKDIEINTEVILSEKFALKIGEGTLYLYPRPSDATVRINGKTLRSIPKEGLQLYPGSYQLSAHRMGYENMNLSVDIKPNFSQSITLEMHRKTTEKAIIQSVIFPGLGQRYAEKKTRAKIFTTLELASIAGIIGSEISFASRKDTYNTRRDEYFAAISEEDILHTRQAMDDAYNDIESSRDLRKFFIITAVGTWALNILESALFPPIRPLHLSEHSSWQDKRFALSLHTDCKKSFLTLERKF